MLISLQAQQKQQQEVLAALTEQLRLGRQQPGPGEARTLPSLPFPPAPPPANQGQGQLPVPPHPPPLCEECQAGRVHICLHTAPQSEASAVAQQTPARPHPPGSGQQFPPAPLAAPRVGMWPAHLPPIPVEQNYDIGWGPGDPAQIDFEEENRPSLLHGRVSPAGSQFSTASTSRFPSQVHKGLHNILRTMEALSDLNGQGSKQITANLVELRQNRKDLSAAVTAADKKGNFPESIRVQVEDSLEQAPDLEMG